MGKAEVQAQLSARLEQTKSLLMFLEAFHGDATFEVRFLIEKGFRGYTESFIRHGDSLYVNLTDGNKKPYCKFTVEQFDELLTTYFLSHEYSVPCFTINSPNFDEMDECFTKNHHILQGGRINSHHLDMDAPKEMRQDKHTVKEYKRGARQKILGFELKPSIVVESKHGYHVYWFVVDGQAEFYNYIQMQLVQYFGGDENCINVARVMRLPGFYHMKDYKDPFPVRLTWWHPELRYSQQDLLQALPSLEEATAQRLIKVHHTNDSGDDKPQVYEGERKQRIMDAVRNKMNVVSSTPEKLVVQCCLPEHEDNSPSAWFDSEYMWFHCSGCGASHPLDVLAEELGWDDVLDAIGWYELSVDEELKRIRSLMVNVKKLSGLTLDNGDKEIVNAICDRVLERFMEFGQEINLKHERYIRNIVHVLWKAHPDDNSYLIPLDMGGGKSTIILTFLEEVFNYFREYGAIVAVARREDARTLVTTLNEAVGQDVALAMYGFDEHECKANTERNKGYHRGVERSNIKQCVHSRKSVAIISNSMKRRNTQCLW